MTPRDEDGYPHRARKAGPVCRRGDDAVRLVWWIRCIHARQQASATGREVGHRDHDQWQRLRARTVNYADLDSVTLRMNLDGLDRRLNALQNGNDYRGMFDMRPYGRTAIYVDARVSPFVVLHARRGVTIFSAADSMTAIELATDLQRVAGGRRGAR